MSNPWEEGRPSVRARSSTSPRSADPLRWCRPSSSTRWFGLIIDHHRATAGIKHSQSLAGFFYTSQSEERYPRSALHFVNVSRSTRPFIYPSFPFLPDRRRLDLLDCCNGLVLFRWYDVSTTGDDEFRYVVCNPLTEEWVALPDHGHAAGKVGTARLGFDPAAPPHFHVFVMLLDDAHGFLSGVDVYSSETGGWIHREKGWDVVDVRLANPTLATVFIDGYLYLRTLCGEERHACIAAVDTKGETWSNFDTPCGLWAGDVFLGLIQQSQGRLHYACINNGDDDEEETQLGVYALEDHANKEWILKHRVELFGMDGFRGAFDWIGIHPQGNLMFFVAGSDMNTMLTCYDMDRRKATMVRELGDGQPPYLPYVPLYSELGIPAHVTVSRGDRLYVSSNVDLCLNLVHAAFLIGVL